MNIHGKYHHVSSIFYISASLNFNKSMKISLCNFLFSLFQKDRGKWLQYLPKTSAFLLPLSVRFIRLHFTKKALWKSEVFFPFQCIRVKKWFKAPHHYFRAKQLNVLYRNIKTIYASKTLHFFNGFQIKQFIYAINNNMQFLIISR